MPIKKCVGVVIYNSEGKIFLMTSPKWKGWLVPGGGIEDGETDEEALCREIKEELGIEIINLYKNGESKKEASSDFKDKTIPFHFIDYFAKALSTDVKPNSEILEYKWFSTEEALNLELLDSTRDLLGKFIMHKQINNIYIQK